MISNHDKPRPITAKWRFVAETILESAACVASGQKDYSDTPILKDSLSQKPMIPGTTIAGALRSHLEKVGVAKSSIEKTFGSDKSQDNSKQSPLIIFDSITNQEAPEIELRDAVKINHQTGIAANNAKYDFEVIAAGVTFPMRFDLFIPSPNDEAEILSVVYMAFKLLAEGQISLGIKKSRGLGKIKLTNLSYERYNMSNKDECMQWILSEHEICKAKNSVSLNSAKEIDFDKLANDINQLIPGNLQVSETSHAPGIKTTLSFKLPNGILIRSEGCEADSPDAVHLKSGGKPIVSGSSIAGALRHHALKVSNHVRLEQNDAQHWVDSLFGPDIKKGQKSNAAASKLIVHEAQITNGEEIRVERIQIDRFTQAVMPAALFDEQIHRAGNFKLELELRTSNDAEKGFFLLLIKDLITGQISIGGTNSIGRGFLELAESDNNSILIADKKQTRRITLSSTLSSLEKEELDCLNTLITSFHDAKTTFNTYEEGA